MEHNPLAVEGRAAVVSPSAANEGVSASTFPTGGAASDLAFVPSGDIDWGSSDSVLFEPVLRGLIPNYRRKDVEWEFLRYHRHSYTNMERGMLVFVVLFGILTLVELKDEGPNIEYIVMVVMTFALLVLDLFVGENEQQSDNGIRNASEQ